ncbi:MAG: hypothetical protein H6755_05060 [Candidatus Omnitrophica bacterium]|nr:hypothetical protein [Candidatus Omnitrophota bacterium]
MSILDQILNGFKEIFKGKQRRKKSRKKKKASTAKNVSRRGNPKPKGIKSTKKSVAVKKKKKTAEPARKKNVKAKSPVKKKKTALKNISSQSKHEQIVGEITHYFSKIQVVVIKITKGGIKVGDKLLIKGARSAFVQKISSLQIESVDVKSAKSGQIVGMKVNNIAYPGDNVYLLKK